MKAFNRITEVETTEEVMEVLNAEFQNITEIKRIFKVGGNPMSVVYNNGERVASVESTGEGYVIHFIDVNA
jgi:hypothetical protein